MHPDLIDRRDKSLARKLHEQSAAREMERHYNKEQILEAFLNQISFGHGWYGIEAAVAALLRQGGGAADDRRGRDARRAAQGAGDLRSRRSIRSARSSAATPSSG